MLTLPPLLLAVTQRDSFVKATDADVALIRGIPPLEVPESYVEFITRFGMAQYKGKVFEIRRDVSISGPDGALHDIYDFKFDGDSLDNNPGQKELYEEATGNKIAMRDRTISQESCKCN